MSDDNPTPRRTIEVVHDVDHRNFSVYRGGGQVAFDLEGLAKLLGVPVSDLRLIGDSPALVEHGRRQQRYADRPRQNVEIDIFTGKPREW